jgi:hypothetical protein
MAVRLTDKILPLNDAFVGMVDANQIVETPAGFKDEDDMVSNSATAFCSQQSIKKYVDDHTGGVNTSGTPVANDIARFTDADTIEGRSYTELKSDLNLVIGTDVLAQQTIGIADNNLVEIDHASVADNDYAKFTANGLEGRSYAELRSDINVEDGADVTDTTNVTAAGALMDSEVDADIKTLVLPANTTISVFGASIIDDTSATAARTTIGANQNEKHVTVESPTSSEDITIFFTNRAITVTEMRAVLNNGASTPSVTWTIRHSTDRSAAGNEVVTSGTTTTSVSTGSDVVSFNDATIPADSFVWLATTAKSGTVPELHITIIFTLD